MAPRSRSGTGLARPPQKHETSNDDRSFPIPFCYIIIRQSRKQEGVEKKTTVRPGRSVHQRAFR